jgi:acetylornithine deacetylase/succinyl-diaminopimelate desuccinylase family protein
VWLSDFLADLVRIESINPETWPGGGGEAAISRRIAAELSGMGLQPRMHDVPPGRPSVVAVLPGAGSRTLLLEAHTDTVQAEGMADPFSGRIDGGRLYGRGSCDDKASIAAFMGALRILRTMTLPCTVVFAATSGEEFAGRGITALMEAGLHADGAIVGEPTRLEVVVAHKGCVRAELHVRGRAAHSSRPQEGRNAIEAAARIVSDLKAPARPPHPLVGAPTLAFTQISGGVGINTIPEHCVVRFDRRVVPGETPDGVLQEMRAALAALPLPDGIRAEIRDPFIADGAMETDPDGPLTRAVLSAVRRHRPGASATGVAYGTDAGRIARFNIPAVVFGPGDIAQAHAADEWVDLAEVEIATRIIVDAALAFGTD